MIFGRGWIVASVAGLAGCTAATGSAPPPSRAECPISESSDWAAWVSAMPGPDRPKLIVTGKVTVPTGGYRLALEEGPLLEIHPPIQQVMLIVERPGGSVTQAIVTHEVRLELPALESYGGVTVKCGDAVLADIRPVERAY